MSQTPLKRRAFNAIMGAAFFSPQSLSIIMLAMVMFAFDVSLFGMGSGMWLLFGIVAEMIYLGAVLTDQEANAAAVERMFERHYDIETIKNPRSRQRFGQALEYYENMKKLGERVRISREQLYATQSEMNVWLEQMYTLAKRVDMYEENHLIARDRQRVPDELNKLQRRLAIEVDPHIYAELQQAVQVKLTQLQNLKTLETNIRRAELQLENTLSAIGTIYAQMQVMDSKDVDSGHSKRLRQDIHDQILTLRDAIDAIDDMQPTSLHMASS
jgi:hypothetical protein